MAERFDSHAGYFIVGLAIGSLISILVAPKSGKGTRAFLSKKVKEGSEHARRTARELRDRAEDLTDSGKELVNDTKEQIPGKLDEAAQDYLPQKSKAKGV
jgi:gas vesicle protein